MAAIEIVEYCESWVDDFQRIGRSLRDAVGDDAIGIHHIGSTSVPGLAAKDLIDVQVTVAALPLPDAVVDRLAAAGFPLRDDIFNDHVPIGSAGSESDAADWAKRI